MRLARIGLGYCALAVTASGAILPDAQGPSHEDRRSAAERALPYVARQTAAWIEQKKCTSCHQVPHALWAMNEARARGLTVDGRLTDWNRWSVAFVLREPDESEDSKNRGRERADEIYQILLAGSTADIPTEGEAKHAAADARQELLALLLAGQADDGLWHGKGQLFGQKRPNQETDEATTMWSLHTLGLKGEGLDGMEAAGKRAREKFEARSTTTEHLVLRYLLAREAGEGEKAAALRDQIISHQNDDGGWGWLLEEDSDALATGQALYALSYMDLEHRREPVRRAQAFLVRTQQDDGSWHVPSTLKRKNNERYVVANDWGTAWAVIGLMRTMEP